MTIKLLTGRSAADGSQAPGDIVTLDPKEEARLIEAGLAEKTKAPRKAKTSNKGDES